MYEALRLALSQAVDPLALGVFRFLFGLILCIRGLRSFRNDIIYYSSSPHYFYYEFAPFIRPYGKSFVTAILLVKIICAAFFSLGIGYSYVTPLLFLSYTYVMLLDRTLYNNHYYLSSIFLLFFCTVNGDAAFSVSGSTLASIPAWQLWLFKFQILIVYVFGGLNKIQGDCLLRAMPMHYWLVNFEPKLEFQGRLHHYCINDAVAQRICALLRKPKTAYLLSWGGVVIDLCIIPLLLYPPTFLFALPFFLLFNLFNQWFFQIGSFPYINYAAVVFFIPPEFLRILGAGG